jgi:hypothetical protein
MAALLRHADDVLRGGQAAAAPAPVRRTVAGHLGLLVLFGAFYGAVMGCFGGVGGSRALQPLYSAVKVPLLLLVTFALSLPSFFVLNTLLGVREDFPRVLRGLAATQAALTVVLASMAPLTAFWYASSGDYHQALAFNALVFAAASVSAQFLLRRWYRPLILRNPRHRVLLRGWLVIYAFVGIQTGWVLRPFVGHPAGPTRFFRPDAWGNAYVEVTHTLWKAVGG